MRWQHFTKVDAARAGFPESLDQLWVLVFEDVAHDAKECVRVAKLRCTSAFPLKESLFGTARGWRDVTFVDGDPVTFF